MLRIARIATLAAALVAAATTSHLVFAESGIEQDDTERGDGTLPLRLPGDGTLPLKLTGEAQAGATKVATTVTITRANKAPLAGASAAAFACQIAGADITKHHAEGTVLVDTESYAIVGICYDQNIDKMEVVAERGGATRSFISGALRTPEPAALSGDMTVLGASPHAGKYEVDLHR